MLINRNAIKKLAIDTEKKRFPNMPKLARTRVGSQFLADAEAAVKLWVEQRVKSPEYGAGPKTI